MPAPQQSFITLNSTSVTLHLDEWQSGGCPILHFNVQYKHKYQSQWTAYPERIPSNQDKFILRQLVPDREYIIMVTAHSEAGVTQGEYKFRTLPMVTHSGKSKIFYFIVMLISSYCRINCPLLTTEILNKYYLTLPYNCLM